MNDLISVTETHRFRDQKLIGDVQPAKMGFTRSVITIARAKFAEADQLHVVRYLFTWGWKV